MSKILNAIPTRSAKTERPITITQGTNTLVYNDTERIIKEAFSILNGKGRKAHCPELWDGRSASRIVEIIANERKGF